METYENDIYPLEPEENRPAPNPVPQPSTYSGVGTGRKESPFANSPYEMHHQPQPEYHYQPQPPVQKPKKEKKPGKGKRLLSLVLILALIAGMGGFNFHQLRQSNMALNQQILALQNRIYELESEQSLASATPGSSGSSRPVDGNAMTPAQIFESCVNSVVAISTTVEAAGFYGPTTGTSSGSGFILTEDGYVVTNSHVVDGASSVSVILHDGTEYEAEIKGQDSSNDLAVLKVDATGLTPAAIGSSAALSIGDMVVAIGNPLGELASTQTVGYISGINREVTTDNTIINMLQTDAAINPGNSGGPLFNMYGQVIGITTAKYSGTTGSGASIEGIGFAIPLDDVYSMITDLMSLGYVTGAYMGITVQNMDPSSAGMYNLPIGAYVVTVEEGGSADRAGIQPKDIITMLDETAVSSITDLTRALRKFKAGDTTTVTVVRGGQELVLDITLDEKPPQVDPNLPAQDENMPAEGDFDDWYEYFRRYFGE